jgi:hypothetical protein
MAPEYVRDRCGEVNPIGTVLCINCHAYLDLAPCTSEGLFRITAEEGEVAVPATAEPAVLSLRIRNTSAWLGCC